MNWFALIGASLLLVLTAVGSFFGFTESSPIASTTAPVLAAQDVHSTTTSETTRPITWHMYDYENFTLPYPEAWTIYVGCKHGGVCSAQYKPPDGFENPVFVHVNTFDTKMYAAGPDEVQDSPAYQKDREYFIPGVLATSTIYTHSGTHLIASRLIVFTERGGLDILYGVRQPTTDIAIHEQIGMTPDEFFEQLLGRITFSPTIEAP